MSECAWSQGRPAVGVQPRCMHLGYANFMLFLVLVSCLRRWQEREACSGESRTWTLIGLLKLQSSDTAVLKREWTAA